MFTVSKSKLSQKITQSANNIESLYYMGSELGRGRFGVVRQCKNKVIGLLMACKTLSKNKEAINEIHVMQYLSDHPNVVLLHVVHADEQSIHLVMELCPGGCLFDSMFNIFQNGKYSKNTTAKVIKELVTVIKYCHDIRVVHRDIKLENILLSSSGQLKLADFGLLVHAPKGTIFDIQTTKFDFIFETKTCFRITLFIFVF